MKKIAVTGATGFIGRHVLAELNEDDAAEVVYVTRGDTQPLPKPVNGRWVVLDIAAPPSNTFEVLGRPDTLIHLAWGGLPNYKSLHHFETELPIHYAFLSQLVQRGLQSLVAVGTCLEYGMQCGRLCENLETQPSTPYAFAKDALRKQLEYFKAKHPFNLIWARLFYMYGAGQAEGSLLPQLKRAVQLGQREFNMSPGDQLRDYLPVTEVARQLVSLSRTGSDVGPINVCSGAPVSIRSLIETWIRQNDWNIKLNLGHYSYPDYEPLAFWGDNSKTRALLGSAGRERPI